MRNLRSQNMGNRFLTFFFIFCINLINAQNKSSCLSKINLLKMQSASSGEIWNFLNGEGWTLENVESDRAFQYFDVTLNYNIISWQKSAYPANEHLILYNNSEKPNIIIYQASSTCFNELLNQFPSKLGKTTVESNKLLTVYKESAITIEFREYNNDNSDHHYSVLIFKTADLFRELQTLKANEEKIIKDEQEKKEKIIKDEQEKEEIENKKNSKYNNNISDGNKLFELGKFEEAKFKYLAAKEIKFNENITAKISLCDNAICDKIIAKGDSVYSKSEFESALKIYNQAKSFNSTSYVLQEKISLTNAKILEKKVEVIKKTAINYFNNKKFEKAIDSYNSILQIDNANVYATQKIKEIHEIKNILTKRKTNIFSYKETNSLDFSLFKTDLLNDINSKINNSRNGFIDLNYKISFDTLGHNHSSIIKINSSIKNYDTFLSSISKKTVKPSIEGGYFLATNENIKFDLKWKSKKTKFKYSSKKGIFQCHNNINLNVSNIENYINTQNFNYGKYIFEIKNKVANGNSFDDIKLIKYKMAGPGSALYSILMPGMGTLKVTYGSKGWGRFTFFLLSSCLAISSKLYSDEQYINYEKAAAGSVKNKYYENYTLGYHSALISGSISASIYLYDILWVFSKGIKNLKQSKSLRQQLHKGPVIIENQSITIQ
jgi:hypothetical protein